MKKVSVKSGIFRKAESVYVEYEVPGFWGFYESPFTDEGDIEWNFFDDPNSLNPKTKELFDEFLGKEADWSYDKEFVDGIGEAYTNEFDSLIKEAIPSWKGSEYIEIDSPKAYNFSTDRVFARTKIDDKVSEEIMNYIKDHQDEFEALLKEKFTARDGFIPYYSNDIKEWQKSLSDMDHNELSTIFECILGKEGIESLNLSVLDYVMSNGMDYATHIVNKNYKALEEYIKENGGEMPE